MFFRLFFLFGIAINCYSQDTLWISATVKDAETKQALEYASISIKNKYIGTSTNQQGEFSLQLNSFDLKDSLIISHIGYSSLKINIQTINCEKTDTLFLKAEVIHISDVIVRPVNPYQILKSAIAVFYNNYRRSPYESNCFYRESIKEGEKYVGFTESFLLYHCSGYKKEFTNNKYIFMPLSEWYYTYQTRRSDYFNYATRYLEPRNDLLLNSLKSLNKHVIYRGLLYKNWIEMVDIEYKSTTSIDSQIVYILHLKPKEKYLQRYEMDFIDDNARRYSFFEGDLFILALDSAIVKIQVDKLFDTYVNKEIRVLSNLVYYRSVLDYTKINGQYFLTQFKLERKYTQSDIEETNLKRTIFESAQLFFNQIDTSYYSIPQLEEKYKGIIRKYDDIIYLNKELPKVNYIESFWEKAIIPPNNNWLKIKTDLSRDKSIEKQFIENNAKTYISKDDYLKLMEIYKRFKSLRKIYGELYSKSVFYTD